MMRPRLIATLIFAVTVAAATLFLGGAATSPSTQTFRVPGTTSGDQTYRVPSVKPANPALKRLCEATDYPALCVSSVSPFLLGGRTDPASVLGTAIEAASQHAASAAAAFSRMAASGEDKDNKEALGMCRESYRDAMDNLRGATEAASRRDQGTANSMLSAVVTDSEDCEDAFQGTVEGRSPAFPYNDRLRKMASNCLAIVSLINWP